MSRHPQDWPGPGAIDLGMHDPPHRSSATEWWYLNTHLSTADGKRVSLFAAFFRLLKSESEPTQALEHAHSLTWAVSDPDARTYHADSRVDRSTPALALERIRAGRGSRDARLNRAMTELLERGRVPRPDRMFETSPVVGQGRLELDFDGNRLEKLTDGRYVLALSDGRAGCRLTFSPEKPPHRHGDDGVVRGLEGEEMFYYFIPRCAVSGTVTLEGRAHPAQGSGWYDHEFGGQADDGASKNEQRVDIAWNWAALQLDGRIDVTAYALQRVADGKVLHNWAVVSDASGRQRSYHDMKLEPRRSWRSTRTFYDYPTSWTLTIPESRLELTIDACFDDQEFITCISKPAFWEGRVQANGTCEGRPVSGPGYVERSGFEPIRDLDEFFHAVGEEVRRSVANVLPTAPDFEQARDLVACAERPHYLDGVDLGQLGRALIAPVREITDRGGKSWRSYAALACCDVVEGDSRKYVQWLAMPELLHVGSLIIDDVEDRSTLRRGGPTCHLMHGEPKAINSGCAAYFLTQKLLFSEDVSPARKLQLYDLYFEAMRAGHAGQALDLDGLSDALTDAVETGNPETLEKRVLAIHRLKAGVPAGCLARMGAVGGGGSDAQIEAVGDFFENLGLAFQIVDDVLNLRGFRGNLKSRGEDVRNGVVTLPIAKAMGRLRLEERRWLADTLRAKPQRDDVVASVIERLETSGAITACQERANEVVESAWRRAEPSLPDTLPKVMLRSFGWYVLERHY